MRLGRLGLGLLIAGLLLVSTACSPPDGDAVLVPDLGEPFVCVAYERTSIVSNSLSWHGDTDKRILVVDTVGRHVVLTEIPVSWPETVPVPGAHPAQLTLVPDYGAGRFVVASAESTLTDSYYQGYFSCSPGIWRDDTVQAPASGLWAGANPPAVVAGSLGESRTIALTGHLDDPFLMPIANYYGTPDMRGSPLWWMGVYTAGQHDSIPVVWHVPVMVTDASIIRLDERPMSLRAYFRRLHGDGKSAPTVDSDDGLAVTVHASAVDGYLVADEVNITLRGTE